MGLESTAQTISRVCFGVHAAEQNTPLSKPWLVVINPPDAPGRILGFDHNSVAQAFLRRLEANGIFCAWLEHNPR